MKTKGTVSISFLNLIGIYKYITSIHNAEFLKDIVQ